MNILFLLSAALLNMTNLILTPDNLNHFQRVSDPQISPNGLYILYGVSHCEMENNKNVRNLYIMDRDGQNSRRLSQSPRSEQNARWLKDGRIIFLCGGSLFTMFADGQGRCAIEGSPNDIAEFALSPAQDKIILIRDVKYNTRPTDLYPELDKASGRIINDLMYRHWDHFVESIPHPFVAEFDGKALGENITDLLEGTLYECPAQPFSGIEQLSWSPDGKSIAYACRKLNGKEYATSTNTDIYMRNLETGEEKNLSKGMMGYDTAPLFSADGSSIVWCSMERDGYEADKNRLMLYTVATGQVRELSANFMYNVDAAVWGENGKTLYITSNVHGVIQLFEVECKSGDFRQITYGETYSYSSPIVTGKELITTVVGMCQPAEVASVMPKNGEMKFLSCINNALRDDIVWGKVESRWMPTTDGKQMQCWVIYPPHFDATKKYPALLFCAGGPQSTISQGFSYRWNMELMASAGYIVIAPNRRGTTAFGQAWCEQISGDYAGQNIQDYFTAVDEMKKESYVDGERIGAVGASYGGYSVYYLAGHHNGRFAAFVAHAGIFNTEHMYMETEEIWFPHWDNGGAPWDDNSVAVKHYAVSPHKAVKKWDTPILITHGELDYRVPVDQAMTAFNAARLLGVDAQMLLFPDENHWILKPQNNVLWNRVFFQFLNNHLKK